MTNFNETLFIIIATSGVIIPIILFYFELKDWNKKGDCP